MSGVCSRTKSVKFFFKTARMPLTFQEMSFIDWKVREDERNVECRTPNFEFLNAWLGAGRDTLQSVLSTRRQKNGAPLRLSLIHI